MLQNSINFYRIITFFLLTNIFKCLGEDLQIGNITIKDGNYLADSFKIISTNKNNLKINKKNKICSIENIDDFYNSCKPFVKIFYDKWVNKYF